MIRHDLYPILLITVLAATIPRDAHGQSVRVDDCVANFQRSGEIHDHLQAMSYRNFCTCIVQHWPFTEAEGQQIDDYNVGIGPLPPGYDQKISKMKQICCAIPGTPCRS